MHGGDIYRNTVKLDFSVNINPFGVPESILQAITNSLSEIDRYPDITCENLKKAISNHFEIPTENILCGNGASELITSICRWKMPKIGLLLGPGFSGYQKALEAVNCDIHVHFLKKEKDFIPAEALLNAISQVNPDILFLANPSNPTGVLLDRDYLTALLTTCQRTGTTVVLDECFIELTEKSAEYSMSTFEYLQQFDNLIILRAFTKSFAIPGIRLGYMLCGNPQITCEISKQLPEWNVSVPAQAAGVEAFHCKDYLQESVSYIAKEREWLSAQLEMLGADITPSHANYLLFQWPKDTLYQQLLQKGILIRDCSDYTGLEKGYYRVAVKKREENECLLQAIREL